MTQERFQELIRGLERLRQSLEERRASIASGRCTIAIDSVDIRATTARNMKVEIDQVDWLLGQLGREMTAAS